MANDAIDLAEAIVLNSPNDVANWTKDANITSIITRGSEQNDRGNTVIEFDKVDSWASFHPVWAAPGELMQYTVWLGLFLEGKWYISGFIQMWQNRFGTGDSPKLYNEDWYYDSGRWAPMTGHKISINEEICFFITNSDARNNGSTGFKKRSNVVKIKIDEDFSARYDFDNEYNPIPPLPLPANDDKAVQILTMIADDVHYLRVMVDKSMQSGKAVI